MSYEQLPGSTVQSATGGQYNSVDTTDPASYPNLAAQQAASAYLNAKAAEQSAIEAAESADTAATSATTATTAVSNVGASVTAAATSATNAANSATTATTQATAASNSASTAATQATNAAASANTATAQAALASASATTATAQAASASTSAGSAATQASTATTQASSAATSATNAATSATNAASSASAAAASAATIDVSNKADVTYVDTQLGLKANTSSLATVATTGVYSDLTGKPTLFSGSYTDLTSKPTIPTVPTTVSSFTNDSGYLVSSDLSPYLTTSTASSTYQTQSGMSSYLTSSTAGTTYFPLAGGSLTGGLKEAKVAMGANDVNLSSGNFFSKTISGASTLTVSNVPATGTAASFILDLTNGGAGAITWFSGVKWAGGTAPTLTAAGRDTLGFFTHDGGTTWTGLVLGKDIK